MTAGHGGKRDNAGRKKIVDAEKKQTVVIRINVDLLPAVERLKQGLNPVTDNQDKLERLTQRNIDLVYERDNARHDVIRLTAELTRTASLKAENTTLKAKINQDKSHKCQCLTAKGLQCDKPAKHEHKINGFVVFTCERHYKSSIQAKQQVKT
jgi:hypothetical protein